MMMRKNIGTFFLILAFSAGGCVSSRQFEELQAETRAMVLENRALQLQLQARSSAPQAGEQPTAEPSVGDGQPAVERPTPPVSPQRPAGSPLPMGPGPSSFPPQHWARAYGPPEVPGCYEGPLSVAIQNRTDQFVQVFVDGVEVRVFGGMGYLPQLPPGQTAYICLQNPGRHNLSGVVYERRGNQLVELQRFSLDRRFTTGTMMPAHNRQLVRIDRQLLMMHPLRR